MGADSGFDTGVSTINENIQSLLSDKDYPPSYAARIINRAIEDRRYKSYRGFPGLKKGHFIEDYSSFHEFTSADIKVKSNEKEIHYPSLTMPSAEGRLVIEGLDRLIERYNPRSLSENQVYDLVSVMVVAIGSSHAFPDGTGRTAVGLADIMLRKYLGKTLDLKRLQKLDKRLTTPMTVGSILMLPEEWNINILLEGMHKGEVKRVDIPRKGTHPVYQVQSFARKYAASILQHLESIDIRNFGGDASQGAFSLYKDSIMPITNLLKEVSVNVSS